MTEKEQLRQLWATRVAEYRSSGLTLKVWCVAHDCTIHPEPQKGAHTSLTQTTAGRRLLGYANLGYTFLAEQTLKGV
ncbi:hypothetical protein [Cohnella laeviribosi]|uniref:hypothetical protein n=1 Tax=Cohnella laeviribosi TaxID=380174 RepID=UPI003D24E604